ncbi:MAG TPA: hypothetical protein VKD67_03675, partial [Acidimicrobiales bacterium]|nr:hypothetical protein [Acidimicrobiales bacterium]
KPWYYDSTTGSNVSNNVDITVSPKSGKMVKTEDCFQIAAVPVPTNALSAIRAKEQALGLNNG